MGSPGTSLLICVMFVFNLLFAITGLVVMAVGVAIQGTYHHYSNFIDDSIAVTPILLIVVGLIVFIISFCGCCGAIRKSSFMIITFFVLLVIVFILEIGIGVSAYLKYGHIPEILEKGFQSTFDQYETSFDSRHAWNLIQGELNCCGIHGPSDWTRIYPNGTLPRDCCSILPINTVDCTMEYAAKNGCLPELLNIINTKPLTLGSIGLGIAILQLLVMCFACCLSRSFCNKYDSV